MPFLLRDLYEGEPIVMEYDYPDSYLPKVITDRQSNVIGYIWFKITDRNMHIDMLEVVEKERGIGTQIVLYLFAHCNIESMSGLTLQGDFGRPFYFWSSLGAEFPLGEEYLHLDPERDSVPFTLSNPSRKEGDQVGA